MTNFGEKKRLRVKSNFVVALFFFLDHDPSTSYCARYLRLFAVQVALHFFQEVSKGEGSVGGKKTKPSGLR